jgi:hypothetical protein
MQKLIRSSVAANAGSAAGGSNLSRKPTVGRNIALMSTAARIATLIARRGHSNAEKHATGSETDHVLLTASAKRQATLISKVHPLSFAN